VVEWAGQGIHGAVYRAVRTGDEQAPPVALKLALLPEDPRFAREVELLSRQDHPHIPHLVDHGEWNHPGGILFPFLTLQWVDGVPLYDWARLFQPSPAQQLRLLAQLALALQALHAQGAVHRDVKGGNTLVRRSDSRLFLTDFGSCIFPGADPLTPPPLPPGTPAYRSPEAWLFSLPTPQRTPALYSATPADDLFALAVTACKLFTGAYPEMGQAQKDEHGSWRMAALVLPKALFSEQVPPQARALILRMLSIEPGQRGTAAQLAQDLERAATALSSPCVPPDFSAASRPRAQARSWRPWLATAATGLALASGSAWLALEAPANRPHATRGNTTEPEPTDTGPAGLGKEAASTSTQASPEPPPQTLLAADTLPEPLPGQTRPNAKGRCPHKRQVALNGGCWMESTFDPEGCAVLSGHMYKGTCYLPVIPPGRPSTTTPAPRP
jgi:serine/threonine protein kinase